jgi:hypothetical protein
VKKETQLCGGRRLPPSLALGHPCCPICNLPSLPAQGAKGPRNATMRQQGRGNIEQAKAEHGHCRRRTEFPVLRDGELVHQKGTAQREPVHR